VTLAKIYQIDRFFAQYGFGALVSRKSGWNIFCSSRRRNEATLGVMPSVD